MLTEPQETAVIAHLRVTAQATLDYVNQATGGYWHQLISGDTGGGERTVVRVVLDDTIPRLQSSALDARSDDAAAARWTDAAVAAEKSLAAVAGYAKEGEVNQILLDTATATEEQVQRLLGQAAQGIAVAVPWYVYAAAGVFLYLEFRPLARGA